MGHSAFTVIPADEAVLAVLSFCVTSISLPQVAQ
jgi:hypothetical protein